MDTKTPPIQTLAEELILWTLNHTANLPKSQRFTFGQRLDNSSLDVIELIAEARFAPKSQRAAILTKLNVKLETLRILWRLIRAKNWMSENQSRHVHQLINEIGVMTGNWLKASNQRRQ